ncbi:MAG TPA: PIG-L family deacetylase [Verrucomicrobiae bacterium]|nr:PIG-L family deacetylase [Verrucomicrobiae bacterium]
MTPYHKLASQYVDLLKLGRTFPLGGFPPISRPAPPADAPKALFFSPHPDDECISGGIALRLLRQAKLRVINVAVTLGSLKQRKLERLNELRQACNYIGFELETTGPTGLQAINPVAREKDAAQWKTSVQVIREILQRHMPQIVIFPHDRDWNSTHIGTHFLVMDALKELPADFECYLVESEFWGAMADPNLMVEMSTSDVGDMMAATSFHTGEVGRNPYHVLLPAWMMDNVRRGAEVAGGQGGAAPDFAFAALYRLRKWTGGQERRFFDGGRRMPASINPLEIFRD